VNKALVAIPLLMLCCSCRPRATGDATAASSTRASAEPSPAPPVPPRRAPAEGDPRWVASVARAPESLAKPALALRASTSGRPGDVAAVDAILDEAAAQPPTAGGLRAAAEGLTGARTRGLDGNWAGSGTAPSARWLHVAGGAILADLARRACAASPGETNVVATIDAMPLPAIYNSGGVDKAAVERLRGEIRSACAAK
jgi:hypothetical protein